MTIQLHHFDSVGSTQTKAQELWRASDALDRPLAASATIQTAGVGRMGRDWQSPHGGIWMTVAWPLKLKASAYEGVPLVAGLAVARSIEKVCRMKPQIKWPNDILIGDRKVCGIICHISHSNDERIPSIALIGLGVNGNFPAAALEGALRVDPTSLADELGRDVDLDRLRIEILAEIESLLHALEFEGLGPALPEIDARLAWRGRRVRIEGPGASVIAEGEIHGLDAEGSLLLKRQGGLVAVRSGEIAHVAPVPTD